MDSASPIAMRIAGRPSFFAGIKFTFANGTTKAENVATRWLALARHRGYRGIQHRPHGEGTSA